MIPVLFVKEKTATNDFNANDKPDENISKPRKIAQRVNNENMNVCESNTKRKPVKQITLAPNFMGVGESNTKEPRKNPISPKTMEITENVKMMSLSKRNAMTTTPRDPDPCSNGNPPKTPRNILLDSPNMPTCVANPIKVTKINKKQSGPGTNPSTHPPIDPTSTHPPIDPPSTHPPIDPPSTHPPIDPPSTHPPINPPIDPPSNIHNNMVRRLSKLFRTHPTTPSNPVQLFAQITQSLKTNPIFKYNKIGTDRLPIFKDWSPSYPLYPSTVICDVYVLDILMGYGFGPGKGAAQRTAVTQAINLLQSPEVYVISMSRRISRDDHIWQYVVSPHPHPSAAAHPPPLCWEEPTTPTPPPKPHVTPKTTNPFTKFIIREIPGSNPISTINQSAQFNKVSFDYEIRQIQEQSWECTLVLGGHPVCSATHTSVKSAKTLAAEQALQLLKQHYSTYIASKDQPTPQTTLSRSDLLSKYSNGPMQSESLDESNIGNKLLRKMGWCGSGGLGVSGEGISEPVGVNSTVNRRGFGHEDNSGVSSRDATRLLKEYVAGGCRGEITFSSELDGDERKTIHQIAHKFGLHSRSHGKGEGRYLVVSRKLTAQQILTEMETSTEHNIIRPQS